MGVVRDVKSKIFSNYCMPALAVDPIHGFFYCGACLLKYEINTKAHILVTDLSGNKNTYIHDYSIFAQYATPTGKSVM